MEERGHGGWLHKPVVDVVIPVYKPGRRFACLLERLGQQTFAINRIIVVNTEERYWKPELAEGIAGLEVHHVGKEEFDHGGTRNLGAALSQADVMVFMTDDAVPGGKRLVEHLVEGLCQKGPGGEEWNAASGDSIIPPKAMSRPQGICLGWGLRPILLPMYAVPIGRTFLSSRADSSAGRCLMRI